jgi:hypothetical protein
MYVAGNWWSRAYSELLTHMGFVAPASRQLFVSFGITAGETPALRLIARLFLYHRQSRES